MPAILCKNSGKDTPVILVRVWVSVDNNLLSTANPFSLNIQSVQQVNSPASTNEAPILYFYGFLPEWPYNDGSIALFEQTNQLLRLVNTIKTIPNTIHQPILYDHRALNSPRPELTMKADPGPSMSGRFYFGMTCGSREYLSPEVSAEIKLRRAIFDSLEEMECPLLSEWRKREIERFITADDSSISCFYDIINERECKKHRVVFEKRFSRDARDKVKSWAMKNISSFVSRPFLKTRNIIYTFKIAGQAGKEALVKALGSDGVRKTVCAALSSVSRSSDTWIQDNKPLIIDNLTTILCPKVFKNFNYEKQEKLFPILKEYQQPAYLHAQLHACYLRGIYDNEMSIINRDWPITRAIPSSLISPGRAATIENLESYSRYKKAEGIARSIWNG